MMSIAREVYSRKDLCELDSRFHGNDGGGVVGWFGKFVSLG